MEEQDRDHTETVLDLVRGLIEERFLARVPPGMYRICLRRRDAMAHGINSHCSTPAEEGSPTRPGLYSTASCGHSFNTMGAISIKKWKEATMFVKRPSKNQPRPRCYTMG